MDVRCERQAHSARMDTRAGLNTGPLKSTWLRRFLCSSLVVCGGLLLLGGLADRGADRDPAPVALALPLDLRQDLAGMAGKRRRLYPTFLGSCPCPQDRVVVAGSAASGAEVTSDERSAEVLFAPVTHRAVPMEQRDLRADLLSMSAAQHTGHWTYSSIPMCLINDVCVAQARGDSRSGSATPAAAETVLLIEPVGPPQATQVRVYSRIAFRPDAEWVVDLKGGPLTLFVQHGRVGVWLERGSAQLERQDPLFANHVAAFPEGRRVLLQSGDRLAVTGGARFRVDNDDTTLAIVSVSRQQTSPSAANGSE
jgi:hypothetical protein